MFKISGAFFTDIITNSSSTVYTTATNEDTLFSIFDEVIRSLGGTQSAKELFDVYIVASDTDLADFLCDYEGDDELYLGIGTDVEHFSKLSWREQQIFVEKLPLKKKVWLSSEYTQSRDYVNTSYVVSTKEGKELPITKLLESLFDVYEGYE